MNDRPANLLWHLTDRLWSLLPRIERTGEQLPALRGPARTLWTALRHLLLMPSRLRVASLRQRSRRQIDRLHLYSGPFRRISFCTTCGNRRESLKRTLRLNLNDNARYPNAEFIVVDYGSTDGVSDWLKENFSPELASGRLIIVRAEAASFNLAAAKNLAHRSASGEILCNLDADNFTGRDFAAWINFACRDIARPVGFYSERGAPRVLAAEGVLGRIFLSRADFQALGGYDERFVGWGSEDYDIVARAKNLGLETVPIPVCFLSGLSHTPSESYGSSIERAERARKNWELKEKNRTHGVTRVNDRA